MGLSFYQECTFNCWFVKIQTMLDLNLCFCPDLPEKCFHVVPTACWHAIKNVSELLSPVDVYEFLLSRECD